MYLLLDPWKNFQSNHFLSDKLNGQEQDAAAVELKGNF